MREVGLDGIVVPCNVRVIDCSSLSSSSVSVNCLDTDDPGRDISDLLCGGKIVEL